MPEYLAPGVYVEEIQTGSKPIEGVSTSTAGMVGVTERGPVNVPILVTSYGDFTRWFGNNLDINDFSNANGAHCYLPHAAQGFFANGGKRLYVTRVLDVNGARHAAIDLFDRGDAKSADTVLLRGIDEWTGTAANPPGIYALDVSDIKKDDWIRIGDGSSADYRHVADEGTSASATHVSLNFPLSFSHAVGDPVEQFARSEDTTTNGFSLFNTAEAADTTLVVQGTPADITALGTNVGGSVDTLLEIGGANGEYHFTAAVTIIAPDQARVRLCSPLAMAHPKGAIANPIQVGSDNSATLALAPSAGSRLIYLDNRGGNFDDRTTLVLIDNANDTHREVRRIGDLSQLEVAAGAYEDYAPGSVAEPLTLADDYRFLRAGSQAKDLSIAVNDASALVAGDSVIVGADVATSETRVIRAVDTDADQLTFTADLAHVHGAGEVVQPATKRTTAETSAGNRAIALNSRLGLSVGDVICIGLTPNDDEYVTIAALPDSKGIAPDAGNAVLEQALVHSHVLGTEVRRQQKRQAPPADDDRILMADSETGDQTITVNDTSALVAEDSVSVGVGLDTEETRVIGTVDTGANQLRFTEGLVYEHGEGEVVQPATKHTNAQTHADDRTILLKNRLGLSVGDIIRIGTSPNDEYVTIAALPSGTGVAPDAGNVILEQVLVHDHGNGAEVRRQSPPTVALPQPTVLALNAHSSDRVLVVTDGHAYTQNTIIRLTTPWAERFYHRLAANARSSLGGTEKLVPAQVTLSEAVAHPHPTGSTIASRKPLIMVQALDAGAWGNRLRVAVEDEETGLVSRTTITGAVNTRTLRLASLAGVEPGTVLELIGAADGSVIGEPVEVAGIDRREGTATLGKALSSEQLDSLDLQDSLNARSREFRLTISVLSQPDPALPSRNDTVIANEVFRHLSLDPRHSRYVEKIVGGINGELRLDDRRPEGESWYVRVQDLAATVQERETVRLGPEALVDILPDGRAQPARLALTRGDDSVVTIHDQTYIGTDHHEPANRTGLYTLKNQEDISLVACPGRTSEEIQRALIDHCETMRYRFAVLDGSPPPADSLNDVQAQRQQYDSKYAALYHPWLLIPDPYPVNLAQVADYAIPPSGHMLGVYARTDIERGVHKAPANEVVRGVTGLQRALNKAEQDLINPSPININVIRDFRSNNRGIRVWGGRVITSDPDWKYVNVRRLLLFIEASIERGLQWVVFEPNSEPLWARVRRTVSNFLTLVWRNGALEGARVEEAFFVKCDRTTMTQTDIDTGQLICVVGVAPVKPAEFVIVRIGLWTAHAEQ